MGFELIAGTQEVKPITLLQNGSTKYPSNPNTSNGLPSLCHTSSSSDVLRFKNAAHEATYLLADVEVVASYKLSGINRTKLEGIFHRIFAPAQLDLTIHDRFGHPVRPQEWFPVPLHVIDEVVSCIRDGSITKVVYDPKTASIY